MNQRHEYILAELDWLSVHKNVPCANAGVNMLKWGRRTCQQRGSPPQTPPLARSSGSLPPHLLRSKNRAVARYPAIPIALQPSVPELVLSRTAARTKLPPQAPVREIVTEMERRTETVQGELGRNMVAGKF